MTYDAIDAFTDAVSMFSVTAIQLAAALQKLTDQAQQLDLGY